MNNENLNNVRRMAERGLRMAQTPPMESGYIDVFQHILDELQRVEIYDKASVTHTEK